MSSNELNSPIIKYLKSLKVDAATEHEIIETDTLSIGVVICEINTTTMYDENSEYTVGACFIDKVRKREYPFVFRKKFKEKNQAYIYYHDIINKIENNDEFTIYEAMKKNDLSFL